MWMRPIINNINVEWEKLKIIPSAAEESIRKQKRKVT
jgi:hypothetical protein